MREEVLHLDVPLSDELAEKVNKLTEVHKALLVDSCIYAIGKVLQGMVEMLEGE